MAASTFTLRHRFRTIFAIASSPRTSLTDLGSHRRYATVGDSSTLHVFQGPPAAESSSGASTPIKERHNLHAGPQARRSAIEVQRQRKFKEYEKLLKAKAAEEGLSSIEELAAKHKAQKDASKSAFLGLEPAPSQAPRSWIEQHDAEMAAKIRAAAEKEAKRKLESSELGSNPNGNAFPIKPLGSILDLDKILDNDEMTTARISELWVRYHSLKGKLSAAIPADTYQCLVVKARQHPQFVLPLPRTIVGEDSHQRSAAGDEGNVKASGLAAGERKQGYEMQFMEWGFLPASTSSATSAPPPTTVMFTPLAEYKLHQEFAQPLLVLTHYTDLAQSKGVVLMRGDITSAEEIEAKQAGFAAAEADKSKGALAEEQKRLNSTSVQATTTAIHGDAGCSSKMCQKDAQLLVMTMQRFYLSNQADAASADRQQLLDAFHSDPESFSVQKLCEAAFTF